MRVWTVRRSVNGGCTDTSTAATSSGLRRNPRSRTACNASMWSWCIFQLPLTSGRRQPPPSPPRATPTPRSADRGRRVGGAPQGGQAGQVASLDQLEGGSTPGRHEVDPVGQPEVVEGAHAVASPDHGEPRAGGHRLGHTGRAGAEAVVLEDPEGPVPQDGPGVLDGLGEEGLGLRADVEAAPTVGQVPPEG